MQQTECVIRNTRGIETFLIQKKIRSMKCLLESIRDGEKYTEAFPLILQKSLNR